MKNCATKLFIIMVLSMVSSANAMYKVLTVANGSVPKIPRAFSTIQSTKKVMYSNSITKKMLTCTCTENCRQREKGLESGDTKALIKRVKLYKNVHALLQDKNALIQKKEWPADAGVALESKFIKCCPNFEGCVDKRIDKIVSSSFMLCWSVILTGISLGGMFLESSPGILPLACGVGVGGLSGFLLNNGLQEKKLLTTIACHDLQVLTLLHQQFVQAQQALCNENKMIEQGMSKGMSKCACIKKYTGQPREASLELNNQCIYDRRMQYSESCKIVLDRDQLIEENLWPFEEGYALECDLRNGTYNKSFCPHFKKCANNIQAEQSRIQVEQERIEKETQILAAIAKNDLDRLNKFFVPFEKAQWKLHLANKDENKNS